MIYRCTASLDETSSPVIGWNNMDYMGHACFLIGGLRFKPCQMYYVLGQDVLSCHLNHIKVMG